MFVFLRGDEENGRGLETEELVLGFLGSARVMLTEINFCMEKQFGGGVSV